LTSKTKIDFAAGFGFLALTYFLGFGFSSTGAAG
jgi:hypothetical protein